MMLFSSQDGGHFFRQLYVHGDCTRRNLLRQCFGRELNEIESVTNINSNINSIYLPMNQIVCEISSGL